MALAGKNAGLYIASNKIAETTECNLKIDGTTIDTTNFDSNEWGEFINGTKSWSLDVTANFKPTDTAQAAAMANIMESDQSTIAITFRFTSATAPNIAGNVIVSSFEIDTSVSDKITFKATLTGSGAPTYTAS